MNNNKLINLIILFISFFISIINSSVPDKSICGLTRDRGNSECGAISEKKYFFDLNTKRCQPFLYLGCDGNENKFNSLNDCKSICSNFEPNTSENGGGGGHGMALPVPKCEGNVRAAVNSEAKVIFCPTEECPDNYECNKNKCCPTNKKIVCNVEYDTGRYAFQGSHTPRFFYKKEVNNCLLFTYYGALGNANNFETYNDCIKYCKEEE
ncbi:hypothetical protein Mgra_00002911 [Meloidogyne graminicola]|uniref:BPTI/Kunitz inhibitor domain-containing protein n=1 Tax=Meloidogyne graminicola TaxID=189291 RepID=A0A8S9ZWY0_9BILA|nr:hypothetical protein Mgra_00002911 [Meloidogyne graminicola]